jgi:hypothetical protein
MADEDELGVYTTVEHDLRPVLTQEFSDEKVSLKDFDLLRVLGTGGESNCT